MILIYKFINAISDIVHHIGRLSIITVVKKTPLFTKHSFLVGCKFPLFAQKLTFKEKIVGVDLKVAGKIGIADVLVFGNTFREDSAP